MIVCESNTTYDGEGMTVAEHEFFKLRNVSNVTIKNYHFKKPANHVGSFYAIIGSGLSCHITIENCTFEGSGDMIYGNAVLHNVRIIGNYLNGGRIISGKNAYGWTVRDNELINSHDTGIYLQGWGHSIDGNKVWNAAKCGIKIRSADRSPSHGRSSITNNYVQGYGILKSDAGAGINVGVCNTVVAGNVVELLDVAYAVGHPKCMFIGEKGVVATGNVFLLPDDRPDMSYWTEHERVEDECIIRDNWLD